MWAELANSILLLTGGKNSYQNQWKVNGEQFELHRHLQVKFNLFVTSSELQTLEFIYKDSTSSGNISREVKETNGRNPIFKGKQCFVYLAVLYGRSSY